MIDQSALRGARPRFRLLSYGGLLVAFFGVISYFSFFFRFPALRDFPWINLPLVLVGLGLGLCGLKRAWGPGATRGSRLLSSLAIVLTVFFSGSFALYVFWMSYQLPDSSRALAVGERAPMFELPAADGSPIDTEELRGRRILLVFYRGHW